MTQQIVYAIHTFVAENDDEISFNIGDPITVLEKDEEYMDGWWQGRNIQGQIGLFPMNYTSPEKPLSISRSSALLSPRASRGTFNKSLQNQAAANSQAALSKTPPEQWDVQQVGAWLESIGQSSLVQQFIDQEITGDILLTLDNDSLKELGVTTYGKRYKVMSAISDLKTQFWPRLTEHSYVETGHNLSPPSPVEPNNSFGKITYDDVSEYHQLARKTSLAQHDAAFRPDSPQSLESPILSRSNTVNSRKSYASVGTTRTDSLGSKMHSNGHFSPSDVSSVSKVQDKNATCSSAPSVMTAQKEGLFEFSINSSSKVSTQSDVPNCRLSDDQQITSVDDTPEYEGWLHKQSDRYKTWNKRWFVLKGTNLFYFKSPKDVRMKGIINLRGYRIIADETIHSSKYSFKAQHDRERTFYFYTDSEEAMRSWVKVLLKTTISRDISKPVMTSNSVATIPLDVARKMRPRPPSVLLVKSQLQSMETNFTVMSKNAELPSCNGNTWSSSDYVTWVNSVLGPDKQIDNLSTSFRDGEILIMVLEALTRKRVSRPTCVPDGSGNSNVHVLDTIVSAFKFMGREGIPVNGEYTIKDVYSGNEDKIISMLNAIVTWAKEKGIANCSPKGFSCSPINSTGSLQHEMRVY